MLNTGRSYYHNKATNKYHQDRAQWPWMMSPYHLNGISNHHKLQDVMITVITVSANNLASTVTVKSEATVITNLGLFICIRIGTWKVNTLRPRQMDAISQTTFLSAFSWMKIFELRLKFHWSLFLRVQWTIFQHWFRWWLGAVQATSHYLNQWWLIYWHIYASLGLNELTFVELNSF